MDILPQLTDRIEQRLLLLHHLADSLEVSRSALLSNDAEAIARGAAHQAALCRQWSQLEDQLQRDSLQSQRPLLATTPDDSTETRRLAQLDAEWAAVSARIRYLTRVHCSLLRHMQRSLAILARVAESCAPTYNPEPSLLRTGAQARPGE